MKTIASEKAFENRVKKYLDSKGCWFIKYWGGSAFTKAGIPDLLVCCKGHFMGVELKAPNGKPSALQIHNLKLIDESGGCGILLYPKDWELFQNFVDCLIEEDYENANINYKLLKGRWCDT